MNGTTTAAHLRCARRARSAVAPSRVGRPPSGSFFQFPGQHRLVSSVPTLTGTRRRRGSSPLEHAGDLADIFGIDLDPADSGAAAARQKTTGRRRPRRGRPRRTGAPPSGFQPTGRRVAALRRRGGFSVPEFAGLLRVSASTVYRWEAARGPLALRAGQDRPTGRGSIPACAGEPMTLGTTPPRLWVYPRVCGGAITTTNPVAPISGLSPRVRGSPAHVAGVLDRQGSIPACAGEPTAPWLSPTPAWVYPRVCGGAA